MLADPEPVALLSGGSSPPLVVMKGELDLMVDEQISSCLAQAVEATDNDVEIDMGEVTFVCSTAINLLVRTMKQLGEKGGRLRIVEASPVVRKVLEITALSELFATGAD